jgi:hypothetical protein
MPLRRAVRIVPLLALVVAGVALAPLSARATAQSSSIRFAPVTSYSTGLGEASGETVAVQGPLAYVTNSDDNSLDIVDLSQSPPARLARIDLSLYGAGPNSVAVRGRAVAVAVEAEPKTDPGSVVFFDLAGTYLNRLTVGALPDMLTFTPNGRYLLVANEGEPNSYGQPDSVDPEGTVSVINLTGGVGRLRQSAVATARFEGVAIPAGVRIFGPGATPAQDIEPEYIAVDQASAKAYVTLQENNAVAVLDIPRARIEAVVALGSKDHSLPGNGIDASDRDSAIRIANWPVRGFFMPDAIASYQVRGATYLVTANEGDARDYDGFAEESRVSALKLDPAVFPNAVDLQRNANLGRLTVTTANGDANGDGLFEEIYAFGSRSFTIWDARGSLVWDSGDQLERITAAALPANFNADNGADNFDNRSDNKGPEPEGVDVGVIDGRVYAFVGLERIGGLAIYDISEPTAPVFVQYVNNRVFGGAAVGPDSGPEIVTFVPAERSLSGRAQVVVANEITGTVTVYEPTP